MKKSELKNGAVVELGDSTRWIKIDNELLDLDMNSSSLKLDEYDDDLYYKRESLLTHEPILWFGLDIAKIMNNESPSYNITLVKSADINKIDPNWSENRKSLVLGFYVDKINGYEVEAIQFTKANANHIVSMLKQIYKCRVEFKSYTYKTKDGTSEDNYIIINNYTENGIAIKENEWIYRYAIDKKEVLHTDTDEKFKKIFKEEKGGKR